MAKELTDKQKQFCLEYLVDLNATQAAIRAGYSEKTAGSIGEENLKKPEIKDYVQSLMDERSKKVELTADNVLNDILDTREEAKKDGKLNERIKCNELLGKHLKLFTDKVDVDGGINLTLMGTVKIGDKAIDFDVGD